MSAWSWRVLAVCLREPHAGLRLRLPKEGQVIRTEIPRSNLASIPAELHRGGCDSAGLGHVAQHERGERFDERPRGPLQKPIAEAPPSRRDYNISGTRDVAVAITGRRRPGTRSPSSAGSRREVGREQAGIRGRHEGVGGELLTEEGYARPRTIAGFRYSRWGPSPINRQLRLLARPLCRRQRIDAVHGEDGLPRIPSLGWRVSRCRI